MLKLWVVLKADLVSSEVRRTVIAGLIFTALLTLAGFMATFLQSFRTWLLDPVPLSRLQVVLWSFGTLIVGAVIGYILARTRKVQVRAIKEEVLAARELMSAKQANLIPALEKPDLSVLRVIAAGGKDARVALTTICEQLKVTEQRAIMACERLQQRSFVMAAGSAGNYGRLFSLTTAGREECHRHGWI